MTFDTTPIPVPVGDCRCPGEPHGDGDVVYLTPLLSMAGGMAGQMAISEASSSVMKMQAMLAEVYLTHGIVDWTFTDDEGQKLPIDSETAARMLPYGKGGRLVADKADDLYAQDLLAPFTEQIARLEQSRRGSTKPQKASSRRTAST